MKVKPGAGKTHSRRPAIPQNHTTGICTDERAWIDLLLSKVALILASVIILAALYHLAADAGRMNHDRQLEVIAQDFRSAIDSAGRDSDGAGGKNYSFDPYEYHGRFGSGLNASVSGEYVTASFDEKGRKYTSVKPLTYKTLPFSEAEVRKELTDAFSAAGTQGQPIPASIGPERLTGFLATLGTKEKNLNISTPVHIEKTLIYAYNLNGTGVKELEYILVYQ